MDINTRVLSGFMELLPNEQAEFDRLKDLIGRTYKSFGYVSLDTPQIERSEVLLAKGGQEVDSQIYFAANGLNAKEPNALALRFDLTIPLARYVAEHFNDLVFPFKRCHIGKVHRGERAQKGRFREFYQCDIDVIGKNSLSINYDAEMPCVIYRVFREMDIGKFTIRISNRKLLGGLLSELGLGDVSAEVLRVIDKSAKITHEAMLSSFKEAGLDETQTGKVLAFMGITGDVATVINALKDLGLGGVFLEGIQELETVTSLMAIMGVDPDYYCIDLTIARGLDYYTGTVYETTLDDTPIGSVCGGGRYEDLASHYTKEKLPGVGISIGLSRLFWQLREHGLLKISGTGATDVLVIPALEKNFPLAIKAADAIRTLGRSVDVLFEDMPMKKKFQLVTKKDAPFTVVARDEGEGEVLSFQYKKGGEFMKEILSIEEIVARMGSVH